VTWRPSFCANRRRCFCCKYGCVSIWKSRQITHLKKNLSDFLAWVLISPYFCKFHFISSQPGFGVWGSPESGSWVGGVKLSRWGGLCKIWWRLVRRFAHERGTQVYIYISQPGPGSAREKFDELVSPIWTFYVTQSFLSRDPFGFWSPWGHACVKNLPRVGGEVCVKFGGDWSGGLHMKGGHRY